jgi:hypothetical protein
MKEKEFCFECKESFRMTKDHEKVWSITGLCPKCYAEAMAEANRVILSPEQGNDIYYVTLSEQILKVSDKFKQCGMGVLWINYIKETDNLLIKEMLNEAHSIMSGLLYGKIWRA